MLSIIYLAIKSVKIDIFHVDITRWGLCFPKVNEWVKMGENTTIRSSKRHTVHMENFVLKSPRTCILL